MFNDMCVTVYTYIYKHLDSYEEFYERNIERKGNET